MKYQKAQHKFNSRKQEVCGGRQSRNVLTLYQSAKRGHGVFMVEMLQRFAYIRFLLSFSDEINGHRGTKLPK